VALVLLLAFGGLLGVRAARGDAAPTQPVGPVQFSARSSADAGVPFEDPTGYMTAYRNRPDTAIRMRWLGRSAVLRIQYPNSGCVATPTGVEKVGPARYRIELTGDDSDTTCTLQLMPTQWDLTLPAAVRAEEPSFEVVMPSRTADIGSVPAAPFEQISAD
jgi:hypothetical protein